MQDCSKWVSSQGPTFWDLDIFPSPGTWQNVESKWLHWNSNSTMTQDCFHVWPPLWNQIHLLKHSCPSVFNRQLCEIPALFKCFSSICVCRSLAANVNTTHAGRAVIVVALVTTSRPGWQEPSTLDISVRVRKPRNTTNYTLKLHTTTHHPQHNNSYLPRNRHL